MTGLVSIATFAAPFIVFIQMVQSDDRPDMRLRLANTYKIFGLFIGLPLIVFNYCWNLL